jgi:hypothetical protein
LFSATDRRWVSVIRKRNWVNGGAVDSAARQCLSAVQGKCRFLRYSIHPPFGPALALALLNHQ